MPTADIYTLSLHDALPIFTDRSYRWVSEHRSQLSKLVPTRVKQHASECVRRRERELESCERSEEHTSELQSRRDLVCRLLLEKKKGYRADPENRLIHDRTT